MVNIYKHYIMKEFGDEIKYIDAMKQNIEKMRKDVDEDTTEIQAKIDDLNRQLSLLGGMLWEHAKKDLKV